MWNVAPWIRDLRYFRLDLKAAAPQTWLQCSCCVQVAQCVPSGGREGEVSLCIAARALLPESNTTMATPSPDSNSTSSSNSSSIVGSTSHHFHQQTQSSSMQGRRQRPLLHLFRFQLETLELVGKVACSFPEAKTHSQVRGNNLYFSREYFQNKAATLSMWLLPTCNQQCVERYAFISKANLRSFR